MDLKPIISKTQQLSVSDSGSHSCTNNQEQYKKSIMFNKDNLEPDISLLSVAERKSLIKSLQRDDTEESLPTAVSRFLRDHDVDRLRDVGIDDIRRIVPKLFLVLGDHDYKTSRKVKGLWDNPPDWWDRSVPFLDPNNGKRFHGAGSSVKKKPNKQELLPMLEYLVHKNMELGCGSGCQVVNSPGDVDVNYDDGSPLNGLLKEVAADVGQLNDSRDVDSLRSALSRLKLIGSNGGNVANQIDVIEKAGFLKTAVCIYQTVHTLPSHYRTSLQDFPENFDGSHLFKTTTAVITPKETSVPKRRINFPTNGDGLVAMSLTMTDDGCASSDIKPRYITTGNSADGKKPCDMPSTCLESVFDLDDCDDDIAVNVDKFVDRSRSELPILGSDVLQALDAGEAMDVDASYCDLRAPLNLFDDTAKQRHFLAAEFYPDDSLLDLVDDTAMFQVPGSKFELSLSDSLYSDENFCSSDGQ